MNLRTVGLISMLALSLVGNACLADQDTTPPGEPQKSVPSRIRISAGVAEAQIIQKVNPVYPPLAKEANVTGTVVLHVIIGKGGGVQQVEFVPGPQLLLTCAMDAVKQWRYKPTLLNGQAVEIDTTVSVVFSLDGDLQTKISGNTTVDAQLRET